MKKTLLTATLLIALAASTVSANAFCWQNMNPANWGTCPKCQKVCKKTCPCEKKSCPCQKKSSPCDCDPCKKSACPTTCDPCAQKAPACDACDQIQKHADN